MKKKYEKVSDDKRYTGILRYVGKYHDPTKPDNLVITYKKDGKGKTKTLGQISLEEAYAIRQKAIGKPVEPLVRVDEYSIENLDLDPVFKEFYNGLKDSYSFTEIALLFLLKNDKSVSLIRSGKQIS